MQVEERELLSIHASKRLWCKFHLLFDHSKSTQGHGLNTSAEERKIHLVIAPF